MAVSKKHVIVTGGAGFIGSHLCDALLARGYAVTAIDNLVTGQEENIAHLMDRADFRLVRHDVSEPMDERSLELVGSHGVFGVLHFACPASPVDFLEIPFEILKVDSLGTMHTVDLALRYRARYVLASTSEIYGDPLEHPQREDYWGNVNTIGPRACYDETKRFAEAYVSAAARGAGRYGGKPFKALNGGIVRIFNTYGPRMRPNDGRVVPEFCIQALRGEDLTIHGDGQQTRSYCHVADLVEGILRYFESDLTLPVNLGNPVEYTVVEFATEVIKLAGSKSRLRYVEGRPDDPRKRKPDITRAKRELGWEPKVSLEQGVRETLEHFRCESRSSTTG